MKYILFVLIIASIVSCKDQIQNKSSDNEKRITESNDQKPTPLILSVSLENRRSEFQSKVDSARKNIRNFAEKYGWQDYVKEEFIDSVMIFDDKKCFNINLLKIAGADTSMELPDTYCAALENRILVSVMPEFYSKVYPEGIESESYEKLLTHEIAHRLHIRILNGNEEAMGPVWFYEGFAMYVAGQFTKSEVELSKEEMIKIMNDPERGSYIKYNCIFRYFADKVDLKELIAKAKNENFNEEMILLLN